MAATTRTSPSHCATNYTQVRHDEAGAALTEAGVPVLDGTVQRAGRGARRAGLSRFLRAAGTTRRPLRPRDERSRGAHALRRKAPRSAEAARPAPAAPPGASRRCRQPIAETRGRGRREPRERHRLPGRPKTAAPGILHKSDVGGVHLGPARTRLRCAPPMRDLAARLGPQVLVARMAPRGVELALGMVRDPQFGPVVTVGAGGVLVELLRRPSARLRRSARSRRGASSTACASAGCSTAFAAAAPVDIDKLAARDRRFLGARRRSGRLVAEIDVNPLVCGPPRSLARRRARRPEELRATRWT